MDLPKLIVLGGGCPFTMGLLEALRKKNADLPALELVLFDRNQRDLESMARYARLLISRSGELPGKIRFETNLEAVLAGADVILNQIRFGDDEERLSDETFALRYGIPVSESLGPAGFRAALRSVRELNKLADIVRVSAPTAWFLNLSTPLSQTVRLLTRAGLRKVLGLCELPQITLEKACRLLDRHPAQVDWSYTGLNHRGFITRLEQEGENLLPALARLLDESPLNGINGDAIRELKALPLKYYSLYKQKKFHRTGKARFILDLRLQLSQELLKPVPDPGPLLNQNPPDRYDKAVLPFLISLFQNRGDELIINVYDHNQDIAIETRARIFADHWHISGPDGPTPSRNVFPG